MKETKKTTIWCYLRTSVSAPGAAKTKMTFAALTKSPRGGVKKIIVDSETRAGIATIFQAAARGDLDTLLVQSPDRLSRVPEKLNYILRLLGASGARIKFTNHSESRIPYGYKVISSAKSGVTEQLSLIAANESAS